MADQFSVYFGFVLSLASFRATVSYVILGMKNMVNFSLLVLAYRNNNKSRKSVLVSYSKKINFSPTIFVVNYSSVPPRKKLKLTFW